MGFVLDGLEAEEYDRNYSDGALVKRILDYFKPHSRKMFVVATMVVLGSLVQAISPLVVSSGIDALAGNVALQLLLGMAGLVAVLGSMNWVFNFVRQTLAAQVVGDVVLALREDAFAAVMKHDLSFYDQFSSGKIVSRVTSDTQDFSSVITLTIELIGQVLMIALVSTVLIWIHPRLAMLTLVIGPVVVIAALAFRRIARWTTQRGQRATAEVNAAIQETVSGIAVAKSFRQEASVYEQFRATNQLAYRVRLLRGYVLNTIFPTLDMLSAIATGIVVYFGGGYALQGLLSAGEWYLFVQVLNMLLFPLTSVASFWSQFQQGLAASERVFALIDADAKVVQTGNKQIGRLQGRITFDRVSFSYDEAADNAVEEGASKPKPAVLRDFSLEIPAGQALAVVGHTGAGKSSLIKLILRFYEFQEGRLLIDSHDIRELDLASYRRQLGLVPQKPFLFSGTIADNLRYGRPDATDDELWHALEVAQAADVVDDLAALHVVEEAVDREVAPREIGFDTVHELHGIGAPSVAVGAFPTQGGDLVVLSAMANRHRSVLYPGGKHARERGLHLLGPGAGREVPVGRRLSPQEIAQASAHDPSPVATLFEFAAQFENGTRNSAGAQAFVHSFLGTGCSRASGRFCSRLDPRVLIGGRA